MIYTVEEGSQSSTSSKCYTIAVFAYNIAYNITMKRLNKKKVNKVGKASLVILANYNNLL